MNSGLFGVGAIALVIGLIMLFAGVKSRGGFEHGGTKIEGPVSFILIIFGVLLMAIANGLPP